MLTVSEPACPSLGETPFGVRYVNFRGEISIVNGLNVHRFKNDPGVLGCVIYKTAYSFDCDVMRVPCKEAVGECVHYWTFVFCCDNE